jgi:hypothetical protein
MRGLSGAGGERAAYGLRKGDQTMADEVYYDKKDQLQIVQNNLLPDEQVFAVYDGKDVGTGFIGLTDKRVILQDNSFVGGRVAVTSVPYSKIIAVSYASNASMFGRFTEETVVAIHTSHATYEILLRGSDKAKHAHDVILHYVVYS